LIYIFGTFNGNLNGICLIKTPKVLHTKVKYVDFKRAIIIH